MASRGGTALLLGIALAFFLEYLDTYFDRSIKTPEQIERMRVAGRLVHEVLLRMHEMVRPGVTTGRPGTSGVGFQPPWNGTREAAGCGSRRWDP